MIMIIFSLVFGLAAWLGRGSIEQFTESKMLTNVFSGVLGTISLFFLATTSWINPPGDKVAHFDRKYMASTMPTTQTVARDGEAGKQSKIMMPGFKFSPFIRLLNEIEYKDFLNVPKGSVAVLYAKDGAPLRKGQAIADEWKPFTDEAGNKHNSMSMLDAENFLKYGGQKGEQLTVLKPGQWAINHYLFEYKIVKAISIEAGHAGVVTSRVQEIDAKCPSQLDLLKFEGKNKEVTSPLVPNGCIGVWKEPLLNGFHYISPNAYKVTIVPTRVQTWKYKGCFTKREIILTVTKEGIKQDIKGDKLEMPQDAADCAIEANVEGWKIPTEFSLLVQVPPAKASMMVASVGTLSDVENKIGTRTLRSGYRDTVGGNRTIITKKCLKTKGKCSKEELVEVETVRPWKILELISDRVEIEKAVENAVSTELLRAGVILKEVQMGYAEIPTGLLATRQREQLADQQRKTFIEEQKAEEQRKELEAASALANMQDKIVKAEQAENIAELEAAAAIKQGQGEKKRLEYIAAGERARANALGKEAALKLARDKQEQEFYLEGLKIAAENPEIVKQPHILVEGGASDAGTLGAFLGRSNITNLSKEAK